jgi:hypothetical protein
VKGVMTNNIDKILARGDKLDDLVDKTAELETTVIIRCIFSPLLVVAL